MMVSLWLHGFAALYFLHCLAVEISVGFTHEDVTLEESISETTVCVEVCEGTPKINVSIYMNSSGSAQGMHPDSNLFISVQYFEYGMYTYIAPMDFGDIFPRHFDFTLDNFEEPYCFQVPIVDDLFLEEDEEDLILTLSGDTGVAFKNRERTITIVDNDGEVGEPPS